jgi:hypothetical protein
MNNTSEFFSFNAWERFLHTSVLQWTKFDLSKINWFSSIILFYSNSIGALRQVFIMSHSYQIYFSFLGSNLNLDCDLHDTWSWGSYYSVSELGSETRSYLSVFFVSLVFLLSFSFFALFIFLFFVFIASKQKNKRLYFILLLSLIISVARY